MGLDDYLVRPTVPQIRRGKREVVHNPMNGLVQLAELQPDSEYFRITRQVLPLSLFPTFEEVAHKRFNWNRSEISRDFMKKVPLIKHFVGETQEDIMRRAKDCGDEELLSIFYHRLKNSKVSAGMSFRPIITPNRSERIIYWDQLCAGAAIYKELLGTQRMNVRLYDGARSSQDLGAQAYIELQPLDADKDADTLTISHIPTHKNRAHVLARAVYSDRRSAKTDFSTMQFSDVPHLDTKERKELDALVVAGWYGVCKEYENKGNGIPGSSSVILYPAQELLDLYAKLRNNCIIQVAQHEKDVKKNDAYTERHLNQAEISAILHQRIRSHPSKYLLSLSEALE